MNKQNEDISNEAENIKKEPNRYFRAKEYNWVEKFIRSIQ